MKDLYLKRNELVIKSKRLREQKFEPNLSKKQIEELIKVQNEVYKLYEFYDNYIKIRSELKKWIIIMY